jgi:hypothetical protein
MNSRATRLARGSVLAGFAVAVAAASHTIAGGAQPSLIALALALAFAVPLCAALMAPQLSLWRTSLAIATSQLIFHGLFALLGGDSVVSMVGTMAHHGGTVALSASAAGGTHDPAMMFLGHAVAAIITIALIRRGELAVAALVHLLLASIALVVAVLRALPPTPRRPLAQQSAPIASRLRYVFLSAHVDRGPPQPIQL